MPQQTPHFCTWYRRHRHRSLASKDYSQIQIPYIKVSSSFKKLSDFHQKANSKFKKNYIPHPANVENKLDQW